MRTRITTTLVDGVAVPVTKYKRWFGGQRMAALAASETPSHAKSSIRKVCAYRRNVAADESVKKNSNVAERRAVYNTFGCNKYCKFYLL